MLGAVGQSMSRLISFRRRNDRITDSNETAADHFDDDAAAIMESIFEARFFAAEFARPHARIAVFDPAHASLAYLKIATDQPHELDALGKEIAPTINIFESTTGEKTGIHDGHLPGPFRTLTEAPLSAAISITMETGTFDRFYIIN